MTLDFDRGAARPPSAPAFTDALARVVERGAESALADVHALIGCHDDELPALLVRGAVVSATATRVAT